MLLSLRHVNGSLLHSPKAGSLHHLEPNVVSSLISSVEVKTVNAIFFMHLHVNLPANFVGVARCILVQLGKSESKHFASDRWIIPLQKMMHVKTDQK